MLTKLISLVSIALTVLYVLWVYIGHMGRSFNTRYGEHKPDPRSVNNKSSFAQHVIEENHEMSNINQGLKFYIT